LAPARQGKRQAQKALRALVADQSQPAIVRATGLGLLGQYDPSASELLLAIADADPLVRLGALRGLGASGPANWQILISMLDDPLRALRFAAVTALLPTYAQMPVSSRARLAPVVDEFLEHLSLNADRAEALTSRALVYLAKGEIARAETDLLSALARNPAWVPGMVNLADLYRATGRDAQAGPLLDQALALSPQASQVRVAAALWRVRQGNLDQAIELLAQGHAARLESAIGYVYAVALSSAGQPAEAFDVIDDLLQADLHSAQLMQLGISLAQQGQAPERLAHYQQVLQGL
jgi:tetratricopeptide (TPR) repeat protein